MNFDNRPMTVTMVVGMLAKMIIAGHSRTSINLLTRTDMNNTIARAGLKLQCFLQLVASSFQPDEIRGFIGCLLRRTYRMRKNHRLRRARIAVQVAYCKQFISGVSLRFMA